MTTNTQTVNTSHMHGTLSDVQAKVEAADPASGYLVLGMALAMLATKTNSVELSLEEDEAVNNAPVTLSVTYNDQGEVISMGMEFTEGVPSHG